MFRKFFLIFFAGFLFAMINVFASDAPATLNMIIFNVGQGNCVYINCPQEGNSLLVDCGSSEHDDDRRIEDPKEPPLVDLEKTQREIIAFAETKPLTIVISHLDKDHYNLLDLIFNTPASRNFISKVIIIGKESSLGSELGDGTDRRKSKANL